MAANQPRLQTQTESGHQANHKRFSVFVLEFRSDELLEPTTSVNARNPRPRNKPRN